MDAELRSVLRFPHTRSGECQCLFTVRWQDGDDGTVPIDRVCLRSQPRPLSLPPSPSPCATLPSARCASAVVDFFLFCSFREEALAARRAGNQHAVCAHPLLASHHFCNVSRLDDRGTGAFHAFLRSQRISSLAGVLWASLVYRRLNKLSTFCEWKGRLPLPCEASCWLEFVAARHASGMAVFTSRHQQSGGLAAYAATVRGLAGVSSPPLMSKAEPTPAPSDDAAAHSGLPSAAALACALRRCAGPQQAHATLKGALSNVGDFIAWQVLSDAVEAGALPACANDDWVCLGPGAKHGLRLLFGDEAPPPPAGATHGRACDASLSRLRALQASQHWALESAGRASHGRVDAARGSPPLLLRDLEHSLCEYSKWHALRRERSSPGAYPPPRTSREPLPPEISTERLPGGGFRMYTVGAEGSATASECAAFPSSGASSCVEGGDGTVPVWMPRRAPAAAAATPRAWGAAKRPRSGEAACRIDKAALTTWFASFWPQALVAGWRMLTVTRAAGASAGTRDSIWISPQGKRYRSRTEVAASQGGISQTAGKGGTGS